MSSSLFLISNLRYSRDYDLFSDGELIKKFNVGNENAENCIIKRYLYIIRKIINSFYIADNIRDDIMQESMIGFFKAIKTYDEGFRVSFKKYASVCIKRQIISALRKSKAYDTDKLLDCFGSEFGFYEQVCDDSLNPEDILISEEEKHDFIGFASQYLSDYESSVLIEYCKGKTYREIAEILNTNSKSVDNALQRVKKKTSRIRVTSI
jgi:RNA polymerase sporulation-specific sigma factor